MQNVFTTIAQLRICTASWLLVQMGTRHNFHVVAARRSSVPAHCDMAMQGRKENSGFKNVAHYLSTCWKNVAEKNRTLNLHNRKTCCRVAEPTAFVCTDNIGQPFPLQSRAQCNRPIAIGKGRLTVTFGCLATKHKSLPQPCESILPNGCAPWS